MLVTRLYTVATKALPNYPLGGIKAKTLQEAKDIFSSRANLTIQVFTPNLTFKNNDREYYTLPSTYYMTNSMVLTGDFYDTKKGARRVYSLQPLLNDAQKSMGNINVDKSNWFTTGRTREGGYLEVINAQTKLRGWIEVLAKTSFGAEWYGFTIEATKPYVKPTTTTQTTTTQTNTVVAPVVKPTQIVVPVAVKPTVKPLINQGYDNTFFVVEPPKEEKSNILPILGLLVSVFTMLK
jgi:hypothetical protein